VLVFGPLAFARTLLLFTLLLVVLLCLRRRATHSGSLPRAPAYRCQRPRPASICLPLSRARRNTTTHHVRMEKLQHRRLRLHQSRNGRHQRLRFRFEQLETAFRVIGKVGDRRQDFVLNVVRVATLAMARSAPVARRFLLRACLRRSCLLLFKTPARAAAGATRGACGLLTVLGGIRLMPYMHSPVP
jgi:hypothetical protein